MKTDCFSNRKRERKNIPKVQRKSRRGQTQPQPAEASDNAQDYSNITVDLNSLHVADLRALCKSFDLPQHGKCTALVNRI